MKTPILFVGFNRPNESARVFAEIRKIRPKKLFIAIDGPRTDRPDDTGNISEVKNIVSSVDWPCEVKTLFRDKNLGCRAAVSSAITWFFSQVEEGIILEDDCLPDQSFFGYCEELLNKYRNDERVMMISGFIAAGSWAAADSYIFSKFTAVWGWASWRRAWQKYDVDMKSWTDPHNKEKIREALDNPAIWKIKQWTYDSVHAGRKNTWDYQWEYALLLNNGVSITPAKNLIENIGFGSAGTHTSKQDDHVPPPAIGTELPLKHPSGISVDKKYDSFFARRWQKAGSLLGKILARIKKWTD